MSMPEKSLPESGKQPGRSGGAVPGVRMCCPEHGVFCDAAWAAISETHGFPPRQGEVARRVVAGQSGRQVARALGLSCETVQTHMKRLYERLHMHCRIELGMQISAAYRAWRDESPPPTGCPGNM